MDPADTTAQAPPGAPPYHGGGSTPVMGPFRPEAHAAAGGG